MEASTKKIIAVMLFALFAVGGCGKAKLDAVSIPNESPADVTASVDKATANPGDIITFTLAADYAHDVHLEIPEISDKFEDFTIINIGNIKPAQKKGRIKVARWYKLQADTAGSYVIEPIEISYLRADGKQETTKTPKLYIEVQSLLGEEGAAQDIKDIKPPLSVFPSFRKFLTVAAALAVMSAAAMLAVFLYRRHKRNKAAEQVARKSAHEEAMDALQRLLIRRLVEHGRIQEFYFEISGILRRYIEARFGAPAIDFTTEEIVCWADEQDGLMQTEMRLVLKEFLVETDMVKFAKRLPQTDEIEKIIEHLTLFVGKTAQDVKTVDSRSENKEELHEHVSV